MRNKRQNGKCVRKRAGNAVLRRCISISVLFLCLGTGILGLTGCGDGNAQYGTADGGKASGDTASHGGEREMPAVADDHAESGNEKAASIDFDHKLDAYRPLKKEYNFYFTYKIVHPWWDAVAIGMEEASKQYAERGVTISYEYLAPRETSAQDQINRLSEASGRGFDVLGVDVADVDIVTPAINDLIAKGHKVMTFSSSDADRDDGCDRIAYVGNTHNYEDGALLTEELCEKLEYTGKVAVMVGTVGAPCHEERALGARDVLAKYPAMEIVETVYDEDSVEKAYGLARRLLAEHEDLKGIICCNMSNPVGAARAVIEAGREHEVVIVGMDHDQEALHYLKDGTIYALGVQDCYSIGFDTIQVAVKIADGQLPGELYPEKTEESTTIIYQGEAVAMLRVLYGEIN